MGLQWCMITEIPGKEGMIWVSVIVEGISSGLGPTAVPFITCKRAVTK